MLINEINSKQKDFDFIMGQEKQDQNELERLEAVRYDLERVVNKVFTPVISESVEYFEKNRFEL